MFTGILLFAAYTRLCQLGTFPPGLTWDEAAIGYNGYAIFHTRRDEWLDFLPVSFQSFGDYKAPLAIYINGLFTGLLGLEPVVVRLPFALAGIAAVGLVMALLYNLALLVDQSKKTSLWWAAAAGFLLLTSPWHLHFSRAGFESGMALSFGLLGLWGVTRFFLETSEWRKNLVLLVGVLASVAAIYTYHSPKIVIPLLIGLVLFWQWRKVKVQLLPWLIAAVGSILLLVPMLKEGLTGQGLSRINTTLLVEDLSLLEKLIMFTDHLLQHLSPNFLLMGTADTLRHSTGEWGVLLLPHLVLLLFSLGVWRVTQSNQLKLVWILGVCFWVVGLVPAALGIDLPHPNRALLALPGLIMLGVLGFDQLYKLVNESSLNSKLVGSHGEQGILYKTILGSFVMVHVGLFFSFWQFYRTEYPALASAEFQTGFIEALQVAKRFEPTVNSIVISNDYGQAYIYALFVRRTNPIHHQGGDLSIKYLFVDLQAGELAKENTLVIATALDDVPIDEADEVIYGPGEQPRFYIFYPHSEES